MSDPTSALSQLRPADATIFLLGELKGQMASMQTSLDNTAKQQAARDLEHDKDHTEFRKAIALHEEALTMISSASKAVHESKLSRAQATGLWTAVVGSFAGVGSWITFILLHP